jgi:hypothetical protein
MDDSTNKRPYNLLIEVIRNHRKRMGVGLGYLDQYGTSLES